MITKGGKSKSTSNKTPALKKTLATNKRNPATKKTLATKKTSSTADFSTDKCIPASEEKNTPSGSTTKRGKKGAADKTLAAKKPNFTTRRMVKLQQQQAEEEALIQQKERSYKDSRTSQGRHQKANKATTTLASTPRTITPPSVILPPLSQIRRSAAKANPESNPTPPTLPSFSTVARQSTATTNPSTTRASRSARPRLSDHGLFTTYISHIDEQTIVYEGWRTYGNPIVEHAKTRAIGF